MFKQTCLEDLGFVVVNNRTIGLFKIADEEVKHPHFHLEPRLFIIVLHHLEERRSNLVDLSFFAKCSDDGVAPAFVIARGLMLSQVVLSSSIVMM